MARFFRALLALAVFLAPSVLGAQVPGGSDNGIFEGSSVSSSGVCSEDLDMQDTYHTINMIDPTDDQDGATKVYVDSVASAELEYYLSNTASGDVAGYKLLSDSNDVGQSTVAVLGDSTPKAIEEWVTAAGSPATTKIQPGILPIHVYAKVSSAGTTDCLYQLRAAAYTYAAGPIETILGAAIDSGYLTTSSTLYPLHVHVTDDVILSVTDRISVKLLLVRTCGAPRVNDATVTVYIGSAATASHVNLPVTLAILANYLPLAGGTMSGNIAMGGQDITGGGNVTLGSATADTGAFTMIKGAQTSDPQFSVGMSADGVGTTTFATANGSNGDFQFTPSGGDMHLTGSFDASATVQGEQLTSTDDASVADQLTLNRALYNIPATATVAANAATIDLANGDLQVLDLQGATGTVTVTINNPSTGAWAVRIIQGTQLGTITWPGTVKWPGGSAPTITPTNDAIDLVTCVWGGTSHWCSFIQDVK